MFLRMLKWTGLVLLVLVIVLVVAVNARHDRTFEAPYPDLVASTDRHAPG